MKPLPKQNRPDGTVKDLAEALELSRRQVAKLLNDGMPENIEAAKKWRGDTSDLADDSPAELRRRRIALLTRQEERLALDIAIKNREVLPLNEVIESSTRCVMAAKMRFLRLQSDLPPRLAGLSEVKMQILIRDAVIEILTELHNDAGQLTAKP